MPCQEKAPPPSPHTHAIMRTSFRSFTSHKSPVTLEHEPKGLSVHTACIQPHPRSRQPRPRRRHQVPPPGNVPPSCHNGTPRALDQATHHQVRSHLRSARPALGFGGRGQGAAAALPAPSPPDSSQGSSSTLALQLCKLSMEGGQLLWASSLQSVKKSWHTTSDEHLVAHVPLLATPATQSGRRSRSWLRRGGVGT